MLFNVLAILVFLSILVLQFHQNSLHVKRMAHRYQIDETTRMVAESAMEEAYSWLYKRTADPRSDAGEWVRKLDKASSFNIPLSLVESELSNLGGSARALEVRAEARIIDTRSEDWEHRKYFDNQSDGTLELKVTVSSSKGFFSDGKPFAFTLIHHYGFLVMTMVSARENPKQRTDYSHCFPLDYALLVRNGLTEFRRNDGFTLNHAGIKCSVSQPSQPEKRGKIYFGGTDASKPSTATGNETPKGNYVFLNLDEKFGTLIPQPVITRQEVGQDVCLQLYPDIQRKVSGEGAKLTGLKGFFEISTAPMKRAQYVTDAEKLEQKSIGALQGVLNGADSNADPGFEILSGTPGTLWDENYARSIIEGDIRQRFFYQVHFWLDFSGAQISKKVGLSTEKVSLSQFAPEMAMLENRMICIPMPSPAPQDPGAKSFLEALERIPNGPQLFTSRFEASLKPQKYQGAIDFSNVSAAAGAPYEQPRFFNSRNSPVEVTSTGWDGFGPYRFFHFWNPRKLNPQKLEKFGIIDKANKVITLRGITHLDSDLVIGSPGDVWTIRGRGVIIAKNIRIQGALKKAGNDDLCVLFSNSGTIFVETDQLIESSLIAIQHRFPNGCVIPSTKLNLKGALVVDNLNLRNSTSGKEFRIEYDPALKTAQSVHSIVMIPIPTFRRYSEGQEEIASP